MRAGLPRARRGARPADRLRRLPRADRADPRAGGRRRPASSRTTSTPIRAGGARRSPTAPPAPCAASAASARRSTGLGPFAYAGDGVSDRCVSLAADRRFARDGLARVARRAGRRLRAVRRPPRRAARRRLSPWPRLTRTRDRRHGSSPREPRAALDRSAAGKRPATAEGDDRRRASHSIETQPATRKATRRVTSPLRLASAPWRSASATTRRRAGARGALARVRGRGAAAAARRPRSRRRARARSARSSPRGSRSSRRTTARAVGFALARRTGARLGRLTDLYVVPEARRGGVAAALVRAVVEALARRRGRAPRPRRRRLERRRPRRVPALGLRRGHASSSSRRSPRSRSGSRPGRHAESFASLHVQTDAVADVERAVRAFAPRIGSRGSRVVGPAQRLGDGLRRGRSDADPTALLRFAREISSRMGAVVVTLSLEVDQVVRMIALDRGGIVDEYLSVPEFYGPLPPGDVIGLAANPTVLARLTGADPQRVTERRADRRLARRASAGARAARASSPRARSRRRRARLRGARGEPAAE